MQLSTSNFSGGLVVNFFFRNEKMKISGDNGCVTPAMLVACSLACFKHIGILPDHLKWQLNAYTNWNLTMIALRYILSIHQWDPFLCVNSVGILIGFRTAFAQGLDDNIRKKLKNMGLEMSKLQFRLADLLVHVLPAVLFCKIMISQKRRIPCVTVTYALTLSSWFVFRQVGKLDASDIYVPHPWKRGWIGAVIGMILTPSFIHNAHTKNIRGLLTNLILMVLPICSTEFDSSLKGKYNFAFLLSNLDMKKIQGPAKSKSNPELESIIE